MNSVAQSMVATKMNSNLNARRTTPAATTTQKYGFQAVMNKAYQSERSRGQDQVKQDRPNEKSVTDDKQEVLQPNHEKVNEAKQKPLEKETSVEPEATSEAAKDKFEEVVEEAVEDLTKELSERLGMSVEDISQWLSAQGLEQKDLMDLTTLKALVMDLFDLENLGQLLTNQEATQAMREVIETFKQVSAQVSEATGQNFEQSLEGLLSQSKEAPIVQEIPKAQGPITDPVVAEGGQEKSSLEVVDLRAQQGTTKENMGNQQQSQHNPSFGEMMSGRVNFEDSMVVQKAQGSSTYQPLNGPEILDQIVSKAVLQLQDGKSTMKLQLSPEYLGKVSVNVTADQGQIKGSFVVENQAVKEMVESNLIQLKEQLEANNIKVDKIEVTVGQAGEFTQQQDQASKQQFTKSKKRTNLAGIKGLEEVVEISEVENNRPTVSSVLEDSTVEYSA